MPVRNSIVERLNQAWEAVRAPRGPASASVDERVRGLAPVLWLVGKVQSGKSSIVRALTGSDDAEIGKGFKPCTRTARIFDFPQQAPVMRFLDTRGIAEADYDPAEDVAFSRARAHVLIAVMRALDTQQDAVLSIVRSAREANGDWPVVVAQTSLHEGYPPGMGHPLPYPWSAAADTAAAAGIPDGLARALTHQRGQFDALPGRGPVAFVPIDFTRATDGFEPQNYGLDAMLDTLDRIAPLAFAVALKELRQPRSDDLSHAARPHVLGYAMAAAAADVFPIAGAIAVPGIQAKMLHSVASIYGVAWTRNTMMEFAGALGAGTLTRFASVFGIRELLKLIPVYGQTIGAAGAAAASFATTFALGEAACLYLERRETGSPDAAAVKARYRGALAEAIQMARIAKFGESRKT